ncbi:MAG: GTPase Era [Saprospiraceae bacterium]|nr:GTPase Era [Saprospiraceae bacterium]
MEELSTHRSGFINIIGRPNVGKSTLMNALVGERMSIITNKPQTTRHRIIGIVNDDNHQMVFSDTPGYIKDAAYKMQERMNAFVKTTFEDGDIMLLVVDVTQDYDEENHLFQRLAKVQCPLFLVLNKIDLIKEEELVQLIKEWNERVKFTETFPISALEKKGTENLFEKLKAYLPLGPVYYPKDQFTDRPERFFVNEIIREKILLNYYQEIPYSCEVVVESFKVDDVKNMVRIRALIYVSRKSQKGIIIGKAGSAIKQLGIDARKSIEKFLEKKVHLELYVKVKDNWRDDEKELKNFGYLD